MTTNTEAARTSQDLLIANWHNIWSEGTGDMWAHPDYPFVPDCSMKDALEIENRIIRGIKS